MYCQDKGSTASKSKEGKSDTLGAHLFPSCLPSMFQFALFSCFSTAFLQACERREKEREGEREKERKKERKKREKNERQE